MKVRWTEAALADLGAIEAFLARRSPLYAGGLIGRIFGRVGDLELYPRLGAVVPEYEDERLRELIESPYRIVYRVGDDEVAVVAVVHGARRLPPDL